MTCWNARQRASLKCAEVHAGILRAASFKDGGRAPPLRPCAAEGLLLALGQLGLELLLLEFGLCLGGLQVPLGGGQVPLALLQLAALPEPAASRTAGEIAPKLAHALS